MYWEHVLLYESPFLATIVVLLALGLPAPLRVWREEGLSRYLRSPLTAAHAAILLIGLFLWVRWSWSFDLVDRDDAAFVLLFFAPLALLGLRAPLHGRSVAEHLAGRLLRLRLKRRPRARLLLDLEAARAGMPSFDSDDLLALRGRTAERRADAWSIRLAYSLGWIQHRLRQLPGRGSRVVEDALLEGLREAERNLSQIIVGVGAPRGGIADAAEALIDRMTAYAEFTRRLAPPGWSERSEDDSHHPADAWLEAVTTIFRAYESGLHEEIVQDAFRALAAVIAEGQPQLDAGLPVDLTLPSETWLHFALSVHPDLGTAVARFYRDQRHRDEHHVSGLVEAVEDVARLRIAYGLLDPADERARSYLSWALEVALGGGAEQEAEGAPRALPTSLAWIRERALSRLVLPKTTRLTAERALLEGLRTESEIAARNPKIWRSVSRRQMR